MLLGGKSRKIAPEPFSNQEILKQGHANSSPATTYSNKELAPFVVNTLKLPSAEFGQPSSLDQSLNGNYTKNVMSDFDDVNISLSTEVLRYALLQTKSTGLRFSWLKKLFGEKKKMGNEYPVIENIEVREDVKQIHDSMKNNEPFLMSKQNLNIFLFYAARFGDFKALKDICSTGVNVNIQDDKGKTPLTYSSIGNHSNCISVLKNNGAIIDVPDLTGRTALHWASFHGNSDAVKVLLNYNASTILKDLTGKTALHLSSMAENSDALHILLRHSLNDAVNQLDQDGMTPMMWASLLGNESCVQLLLSYGSNVEIKGNNDMNAFHYLFKSRTSRCCSLIIRYHPSIMSSKESHGRTLLHLAALEGNITILQYLLEIGCNINEPDSKDQLPLHLAVLNGHAACVALLANKTAELDAKDVDGATPLHYASIKGHYDCAMILIKRGADVDMRDNHGGTCLMWAAKGNKIDMVKLLLTNNADHSNQDYQGNSILHVFAQNGCLEGISLLLRREINVDIENDRKETPLIESIKFDKLDICNSLIHEGASVNIADIDGKSPLHHAILKKHPDIVKTILNSGAQPDSVDKCGRTPLHEAVNVGNIVFVELLLRFGANPNILDSQKCIPLHISAKKGLFECCRVLLLTNSKLNLIDANMRTPLDYAIESKSIDCQSILQMCGGLTFSKLQKYSIFVLEKFFKDIQEKVKEKKNQEEEARRKNAVELVSRNRSALRYEKGILKIASALVIQHNWRKYNLSKQKKQDVPKIVQKDQEPNVKSAILEPTTNSQDSMISFESHDSLCNQLATSSENKDNAAENSASNDSSVTSSNDNVSSVHEVIAVPVEGKVPQIETILISNTLDGKLPEYPVKIESTESQEKIDTNPFIHPNIDQINTEKILEQQQNINDQNNIEDQDKKQNVDPIETKSQSIPEDRPRIEPDTMENQVSEFIRETIETISKKSSHENMEIGSYLIADDHSNIIPSNAAIHVHSRTPSKADSQSNSNEN